MYPLFVPVVLYFVFYLIVYFNNPLAIFSPKRTGSWNRVFSALGLPFRVKEPMRLRFLLLVIGIADDVIGFLTSSFFMFIVLEIVGSFMLLMFTMLYVPVPFPPKAVALPYPREGRARFEGPAEHVQSGSGQLISVADWRLFYISNRNAHFFSLPTSKTNMTETLSMFLDQSKPKFAWIQIIYERANLHQALEFIKFGLIRDKADVRHPVWSAHADVLLKKVNEALASDLFAVSVRGIVIGADPMALSLSFADEVDSLAVFETKDPNLFYDIVKRRMPKLKIPNYFGSRHETAFFLTNNIAMIISPPSKGNISAVPAGIEPLLPPTTQEQEGSAEIVPVPTIEEPFHFPSSGIVELVYDGKIHVMFGGEYEKALKSLGVSTIEFDPTKALLNVIS